MAGVPRRLGGAHRLGRQQQPGIQIEPDMAVIHPRLAFDHRILVSAEQRQPFGDETLQNLKRLAAGHGKTEIIQIAEMIRAPCRDKGQNLGGDGIGGKIRGLWDRQRQIGGFTVFRVIIPFAANRLTTLHQHIMMAAHLAIEELHAQLLAPLGPRFEHAGRGHEPVIGTNLDGESKLGLPVLHRRQHPVLTGRGDDQPVGAMAGNGARHFAGETAAVAGIIKADVVDRDALGAKLFGKMAHRGKQEGHLALVMTDIGDLLDHLGHQHHIIRLVQIGKAGQPAAQLVTKDKPECRRHQDAPSRSRAKAASASSRDCFRSTTGLG